MCAVTSAESPRRYPFGWPTPIDPPPLLAELREAEPVAPVTLPSGDVAYLVSRYEDARRVWSDPVFSRAAGQRPGAPQYVCGLVPAGNLLGLDPPEHTELRRVVSKAFTPRRIENMRSGIQDVTDELLARIVNDGPPTDLVEKLCAPLPMIVICQLLGVPYEDRASFRGWVEVSLSINTHTSEQQRRQAGKDLRAYIRGLIAAKREEPADDLLTTLSGADDQGDQLTESQLVSVATQLLVGGNDTTANQLAINIYVLLRDHEAYATLAANPGQIPAAVEELMRLYLPGNGTFVRIATQDVELAGAHIPAGSGILVNAAAANRDPAVFPDAEKMDFERADNNHLSFGHGPHFCLGAALARVELQVALACLVRRFPGLRLASELATVPWQTGNLIWGPQTLPITW